MIQNNFTVCGSCRSVMDVRVDVEDPDHENLEKAVRFAYCSTCKRGHKLPRGDLAPNPVFCAICSYQAVTVTKSDGKTHTICPQCFKCVTHSLHAHCTALHYTALHHTIRCSLTSPVPFIMTMYIISSCVLFVSFILTGTRRGCRTAMTRARTSGERSHHVFILLLLLLLLPLLLLLLLLLLHLLSFFQSFPPRILHLHNLQNNLILPFFTLCL